MKYISPLYGHLPRRDVYLDLTSKDVVGYVGTIVFCILLSKVSELDFPLDKQLSFIYKKISKDCYSFLRLVAEISGLDVRLGQNEISSVDPNLSKKSLLITT